MKRVKNFQEKRVDIPFEENCGDLTVAKIIFLYENEGLTFEINDGHTWLLC